MTLKSDPDHSKKFIEVIETSSSRRKLWRTILSPLKKSGFLVTIHNKLPDKPFKILIPLFNGHRLFIITCNNCSKYIDGAHLYDSIVTLGLSNTIALASDMPTSRWNLGRPPSPKEETYSKFIVRLAVFLAGKKDSLKDDFRADTQVTAIINKLCA